MRVDDQRGQRRQHHHMAVGRRLGKLGQRHAAALARPVLHDHGFAERGTQAIGQQARDHIGRLARRKADQDARDLGAPRIGQPQNESRNRNQQTPHAVPPFFTLTRLLKREPVSTSLENAMFLAAFS
jgi:hypothetical protein